MPEKDFETKSTKPARKIIPISSRTLAMEQLHSRTTDELVKMLLSPDMAKPANAPLRQQIIKIFHQREINSLSSACRENRNN